MSPIHKTVLAAALVGFALPVVAHHSYAMFDIGKTVTVEGTVKRFQWTNPHSWLTLDVPANGDQSAEWAIEMGAPSGLAQRGWNPKTLAAGMKVKVTMHPLKDGTPGGQFVAATLPDGKQMGDGSPRSGNAGETP